MGYQEPSLEPITAIIRNHTSKRRYDLSRAKGLNGSGKMVMAIMKSSLKGLIVTREEKLWGLVNLIKLKFSHQKSLKVLNISELTLIKNRSDMIRHIGYLLI